MKGRGTAASRWALALAACLSYGTVARAEPDASTRATARVTAEEALALYDKGDYAAALQLFNRADALVHAPTLGLMAARCLDKLDRLVEASERYVAVAGMQLEPGARASQVQAQATAQAERQALEARLPLLTIEVKGVGAEPGGVTLDGQPVPSGILGLKRPTDPGVHHLEMRKGTQATRRDFVMKVGQRRTITLRFDGSDSSDAGTDPPSWFLPAGVALVGAGAVGLGGGIALAFVGAKHGKAGLEVGGGMVTTLGAASCVAGATLLVLRSRGSETTTGARLPTIEPWFAGDRIGVRGSF